MPNEEILRAQIGNCNWKMQLIRAARWAYEPEDFKSELLFWQDSKIAFEQQLKELSNDSV